MTVGDLPWAPEAAGIGSVLMTEPGLPRDDFGHPYQALFWFDAESRILGLVVDGDGHVLGDDHDAQGDPLLPDPPKCRRLPDAVEDAARRWWADQRNAS